MAFVYWAHLPEHTDMFTQGYIGFTSKTVKARWKQHKDDAKRYTHLTFYKALAKYGDAIVVDTILEGSNEYCLEVEYKLRPDNKIGWNIKVGGDLGSIGVIPSEETRQKMSEARQGEKNHFHGKTHSDEQKEKWSLTRKGTVVSEETKLKQSLIRKGKKLNLTDEQRAKASERAKAYRATDETKAKQSAQKMGMYVGWRAGKASPLWLDAIDIWEFINEHTGNGPTKTAKQFNCTWNQVKTIFKKIKSGWCPSEDEEYMSWLKHQKELHESTCTT